MTDPARPGPVFVFDLGGVLIDWDPRHLYRKLFDDKKAMEKFLTEVCTPAWNVRQDAGRRFVDAVAMLVERHPDQEPLIEAYDQRWGEMIAGPIAGTVAILEELRAAGHELHAITNWSAEKFPVARERFEFLQWFGTIVVSGEEKMIKPDQRIFELLLSRIGRQAEVCVYVDDSERNVEAAAELGFDAIHFTAPDELRDDLLERGFALQEA